MAVSTVKVWNDNFLPYKEKFEDEKILIEPNKFILMDREKAVKFLGTYAPIEFDGGGVQKPESYKKLRIEMVGSPQELGRIKMHKCQGCSYVGTDEKDLDSHITEFHAEQLLDKDEFKKRTKK